MKVGLNVDGNKHKFCKVYNHILIAYFIWAYTNVLDLMSASTCQRSSTSKALNLFVVRTLALYLYFSLQFHFFVLEVHSFNLQVQSLNFIALLKPYLSMIFSLIIINLLKLPVLVLNQCCLHLIFEKNWIQTKSSKILIV